MDRHERDELDNYITGHYGDAEELFDERDSMYNLIFGFGILARKEGKLITECPYTDPDEKQWWQSGWADQDSVEHEYEV